MTPLGWFSNALAGLRIGWAGAGCRWLLIALGLGVGFPCDVGLQAAEGTAAEREGAELAAELRSQRPGDDRGLATSGVMRLRDPNGKWTETVPVRMQVRLRGVSEWRTEYTAFGAGDQLREHLTVIRREGMPTQYDYVRTAAPGGVGERRETLAGSEAAIPFAGSEFTLADLGMEFLHWPVQRIVRAEMRKGRSCKILESIRPNPPPDGYARVWSWIDLEHRGILRAEAYDGQRRLLKEFSIGGFKKVDGRWQLKSMEIRNERTDARTRLEFDFEVE